MRVVSFASLAVAALAACTEPDPATVLAEVTWAEWPAEVLAASSFTVRIIGYGAVECREVEQFNAALTVDNSAVTFEPYFVVSDRPGPCPILERRAGSGPPLAGSRSAIPILPPYFDTRAAVPGLEAQLPRTYEIRAASDVLARSDALEAGALPIRTFGEVTVRSDAVDAERTNAGGHGYAYREQSTGCWEFYAGGVDYVIENPPPDTAQYWFGFVRGYLHEPPAPVCGEERVFHLVSRN